MGALSNLDEFLLNPQLRTCSGTVPGTSRNNGRENREPNGVRSLNDPYPEVVFFVRQASTSADSDREETSHKVDQQSPRAMVRIPSSTREVVLRKNPHSGTVVFRLVHQTAHYRSLEEPPLAMCSLRPAMRKVSANVDEPSKLGFCEISSLPVNLNAGKASAKCNLNVDKYNA